MSDQRKNFRSSFEMGKTLVLRSPQNNISFSGLLLEESHSGFSCIAVGDLDISEGETIEWIESDSWLNLCKVVRVKELLDHVLLIAVTIVKDK